MTRLLVLWASLIFIAGFAILTLRAIVEQGFSLGSLLSLLIIILLTIGIGGALIHGMRR